MDGIASQGFLQAPHLPHPYRRRGAGDLGNRRPDLTGTEKVGAEASDLWRAPPRPPRRTATTRRRLATRVAKGGGQHQRRPPAEDDDAPPPGAAAPAPKPLREQGGQILATTLTGGRATFRRPPQVVARERGRGEGGEGC